MAAYFEERYTSRHIDVATERSGDPVARLAVLRSLVVEEKEAEVASEPATGSVRGGRTSHFGVVAIHTATKA